MFLKQALSNTKWIFSFIIDKNIVLYENLFKDKQLRGDDL
jgi:hypothetical protein